MNLLNLIDPSAIRFYREAGNPGEICMDVIANMYDDNSSLEEWANQIINRDCISGSLELIRIENGPPRKYDDGLDDRDINLVFVFGRPVTLADINQNATDGFRVNLWQTSRF